MNPLSHARCREQIFREELSPESEVHLERCPSCARFLARFDKALELAPSLLVPPMPVDLPDRLLVRLRENLRATDSVERIRQRTLERRRLLTGVAVALAVVVLALVLVPLLSGPSPQSVLRSATTQTAAQGRASLDLMGTLRGETGDSSGAEPEGSLADQDLVIAVDASGGTAFGDRMQLTGSLEVERAPAGVDIAEGRFDQLVAGGKTYTLAEGGYREATGPPPIGQFLRSSDSPLEVLQEGARGDVQDLGQEELDGEPVHHFRFQVPPGVFQSPLPSMAASDWTTDVWVGIGDRLLRKFRATAEGESTEPLPLDWTTSMGVRLSEFGGSVFDTQLRGTVSAGNDLVLPLSPGTDLARYSGRSVVGRSVAVQAVVGDEAIWVGSDRTNRVFGVLRLRGESVPRIRKGDRITFQGEMRPNPSNPAVDFDLGEGEGLGQLEAQGQHITITKVRVS